MEKKEEKELKKKLPQVETYFSKNADILLKQKHLTQKDFCEKLNRTKSSWDNIVNTNDLGMLKAIADILDMSIDEVIGKQGDTQKFRISGFVKLNDTLREIISEEDVRSLLQDIELLNQQKD